MQYKLKFYKHVDFVSNLVIIIVLVLLENQMKGGLGVLHEHRNVLLFSYLLILTLIILNYM